MMSDETRQRITAIMDKVKEIMSAFGVTEDRAWQMVASSDACKAAEVAAGIERRQKLKNQALIRSKSAELNTLKANMEEKE